MNRAPVATDFGRVIDANLRRHDKPRGDEQAAHISDLFGCDLATHARRSGLPQLPFSPETLLKFEMGKDVEAKVSRAIREDYPGDSNHQVRIAWNPFTDVCVELSSDCQVCGAPTDTHDDFREGHEAVAEPAPVGSMVGHVDTEFVDDEAIIEIKSTVFFHGKTPTEPEGHYIEQAAGYATARGRSRFALIIVCRSTGKKVWFWFDTSEFAMDTVQRAEEVLEKTNPANPAPQPAPRTSWACKTCRFAACDLNKNPAKGGFNV